MKLNVKKDNDRIKVSLFMTKEENNGSILRKQKVFKISPTQKNINMLEKSLNHVIRDFDFYSEIYNRSKMINYFEARLKLDFEENLIEDEYLKRNFDDIVEIIQSFLFEYKSQLEVEDLRSNYGLSDEDIICAVIGTFGYGKTTLIKKILGFPDRYPFPLIDKGRTTIHECVYRAMLLGNDEKEKYRYRNRINMYSVEEIFDSILLNINSSFKEFVSERTQKKENDIASKQRVLKKFIEDSKAKLDEVFGDIDDENCNKGYYMILLEFFEEAYKSICANYQDCDQYEKELAFEFKNLLYNKNDEYIESFIISSKEYLYAKISTVIEKTREITDWEINWDEKNNVISFDIEYSQLPRIIDFYKYFISNKSELRGLLVRLFVRRIFVEFPISEEYEESISGYKSITLIDTMGASHTKKEMVNDDGVDHDIVKKLPLLKESDAILLLDKATQSMDEGTLRQMRTLYNLSLKDKTILTYSFYDYFLKNDLKNDNEREEVLKNILNERIVNLNVKSSSYKKETFAKSLSENRMVFLKGLVQYVPSKESQESSGVNSLFSSYSYEGDNEEVQLSKRLNDYGSNEFNGSSCIIQTMKTIVRTHEYNAEKLNEFERSNFKINIDESQLQSFYEQFSKEYLEKQYDEYIYYALNHKISEALCYRLMRNKEGYSGSTRELWPLADAIYAFANNLNVLFDRYVTIEVRKDEDEVSVDKGIETDYIEEKLKSSLLDKAKNHFRDLLIYMNKSNWEKMYRDGGYGVQKRRGQAIYRQIESVFKFTNPYESPDVNIIDWTCIIKDLFNETISEFKDEYDIN